MPPSSIIAIYPFLLHRNKDIYPNPEEFIPERFLDEENKFKFIFGYIPFSAGSRNCIGNFELFYLFDIYYTVCIKLNYYKCIRQFNFSILKHY